MERGRKVGKKVENRKRERIAGDMFLSRQESNGIKGQSEGLSIGLNRL